MKKKGFTLIEIIICITLLTLISTISFVLIRKKEKNNDKINEVIYNSANVYFDLNEVYTKILNTNNESYIKINDLINEGLIDDEKYSEYKNKCVKYTYDNEILNYEISDTCLDLPYIDEIKESQIINPDFDITKTEKNVLCYETENELPKYKINLNLNGSEFISLSILKNETLYKTINNYNEIKEPIELLDGDTNIKFILKYKINNIEYEKNIEDKNSFYLKKDFNLTINNNEINLINNYNDDDALTISYQDFNKKDETLIKLNSINDIKSFNNEKKYEKYIKVEDNYCGGSKEYKLNNKINIKQEYISESHFDYLTRAEDCSSYFNHVIYYVFEDGAILYSNYKYCTDECNQVFYIFNPITNEKKVLHHFKSLTFLNPGAKVEKTNDGYYIYLSQGFDNYYDNELYLKYEYKLSTKEIKLIESAHLQYRAGLSIGYNTNHTCSLNYIYTIFKNNKTNEYYDKVTNPEHCYDVWNGSECCLQYNRNKVKPNANFEDLKNKYNTSVNLKNDYNNNINEININTLQKDLLKQLNKNYDDEDSFVLKTPYEDYIKNYALLKNIIWSNDEYKIIPLGVYKRWKRKNKIDDYIDTVMFIKYKDVIESNLTISEINNN